VSHQGGWSRPSVPHAPGWPQKYDGDHTFLLVAYGLSFHAGELPEISLPNDVSPFKSLQTQREFVSSEDLGYSEK
jgi:hypothetical protein